MSRLLILGGAGFLGANCATYFRERGHTVAVMDNLVRRGSELNLPTFRKLGIDFFHGDVRNREDFNLLPAKIDFIIDCSAQPSTIDGYDNPTFDLTNNTYGLVNALEFARMRDAGLLFCSTNRVYSADRVNAFPLKETATRWIWNAQRIKSPVRGFDATYGYAPEFDIDGAHHSVYGLSKVCADLICQEWTRAFGVPAVINRFGVLTGEGQFGKCAQGWVAWWAIAAHFDLPLQYIGWKGKQVRDILFAEDACRLFELEMKHIEDIKGEAFNAGGGKDNTMSLLEATQLVGELFGKKLRPSMQSEPRTADFVIWISDFRKATKRLGWKPQIGVRKGYERIAEWVRREEANLRSLYV